MITVPQAHEPDWQWMSSYPVQAYPVLVKPPMGYLKITDQMASYQNQFERHPYRMHSLAYSHQSKSNQKTAACFADHYFHPEKIFL